MATQTEAPLAALTVVDHTFGTQLRSLISRARKLDLDALKIESAQSESSIDVVVLRYSEALRKISKTTEADALDDARGKIIDSKNFGGLDLRGVTKPSAEQQSEALFLVESWLETITSREKSLNYLSCRTSSVPGVRPMTAAQKIFAQHVIGEKPKSGLAAGDVVRVGVDWILSSELSWGSMNRIHKDFGSPGIWRNDRFWLAGDHVVHPDVASHPKIKAMVEASERAKRDFKMTEYQGMNYTIMHTEFVRERVEPGMLAIGADSHTCSGGAVGCLSIGLGTADVMMTLALGETWFKIPESILIEFVGKPAFGMSGKDVILHILKELKRNTVAAERIVEFSGEGLKYLSCDARFAIANMCTEFGAITGMFVPDRITSDYVSRRRRKANKTSSLYFRPDPDAHYAGRYTINLSDVEASIAVYPKPDDVVPVSEKAGTKLDGVFIGACTTTEEELVLGALVLKVGLERKLPLAKGKRHYVPGSLPIVEKLRELKLLEVYEAAGFTRGPPGCSYCVGLSAEKASEGETWLSSQNRNFENRMGKGAFGHVTSAIVCAASSFSMSITSPAEFLKELDTVFFQQYRQLPDFDLAPIEYSEPDLLSSLTIQIPQQDSITGNGNTKPPKQLEKIISKVVVLPDFVDTDALAPGPTLTTCTTDEEFGQHVLEYTHPDFRERVRNGQQIVVAGHAFGVGSSREVAVSALKGAGVKAVIARSFAFIYGRNQPSLGLLGVAIDDDEFHQAAAEGEDITIDIPNRTVRVGDRDFAFQLSDMEYNLTVNNGIAASYKRFGKGIWETFTREKSNTTISEVLKTVDGNKPGKELQW
ncbi:hypothetical protein LTR84_007190 [Exophiala bonariae]|uniref:Uncharacterized protein n=1 Tax=Exophiala bonariae TaxID=1690606 RepID=A0AAV9N0W5_9EURO|nr:hypothetical protein LTR84_007190 [Exophiala bonariae]